MSALATTSRPDATATCGVDTRRAVAVRLAERRRGSVAARCGATSNLAIEPGEFAAMLGPERSRARRRCSGAARAAPAEPRAGGAGSAAWRRRRDQIGYLPQRRHFDAGARIRGIDLVRLGLDGARWGLPLPCAPARRAQVGAGDRAGRARAGYATRPIGELSGGEQQRLLIAQALVSRPAAADPRRAAGQPRPPQPDRGGRAAGARSAASRG